jgi:hypothetical protein
MAEFRPDRQVVSVLTLGLTQSKFAKLYKKELSYEVLRKVKVIPQQAEVAQGVPGRLRSRIFLMFGTTRVVGRQPQASVAFSPTEIPGTHFQGLSPLE